MQILIISTDKSAAPAALCSARRSSPSRDSNPYTALSAAFGGSPAQPVNGDGPPEGSPHSLTAAVAPHASEEPAEGGPPREAALSSVMKGQRPLCTCGPPAAAAATAAAVASGAEEELFVGESSSISTRLLPAPRWVPMGAPLEVPPCLVGSSPAGAAAVERGP